MPHDDKSTSQSSEQAIWNLYLEKCKEDGTTPNIKDFSTWARTLVSKL